MVLTPAILVIFAEDTKTKKRLETATCTNPTVYFYINIKEFFPNVQKGLRCQILTKKGQRSFTVVSVTDTH